MNKKIKESMFDLYSLITLQTALWNLEDKLRDKEDEEDKEKREKNREAQKMLSMMALVTFMADYEVPLEQLHQDVKRKVSGSIYELDREIKKHQEQLGKR